MSITDHNPRETPGPETGRVPGDVHMWVMVLGDLFFFGCYFITYMVFRARSVDEFASAQRHLHMGVGVANTIVLLASSLFVALAVAAVRTNSAGLAQRYLAAAGVCGVVFTLLEIYEWQQEIGNGRTVSQPFFGFYYVFTGIHLAHLFLGLLILGIVARELRVSRSPRVGLAEQGAVYWHMVDLLWIVIFAILYLMR